MKRHPNISIIIPVYNVEEYIADCLQSVMRQTYSGAMECIVVDDCGKDKSIAIAEQLISTYNGAISFRVLHHNYNRGLSAARNSGMDVAKGDYIYFLDSDDFLSDECLETLTEPLNYRDYEMIIGDYETFGDHQEPSLLFEQQNEVIGNENIYHELAERQLPVIACNKLYNFDFLTKNSIDFVEGQLHEDDLWTYKICLCATKIAIQHKVTYYYRQHANSIVYSSDIKLQRRFKSVIKTAEYILRNRPKHLNNDFYRCSLTYVGKGLSYAIDGDFIFYEDYKNLRLLIDYNPLWLYLKKQITLLELKRAIHLAMLPSIGYAYLLLRRAKNSIRL